MKLHSNITVMDGKWSVGGVVQKAAKQCVDEESFYVMDIGEIVRRYRSWRKLMPRVEVFYAVKCNPDKMLVRTLSALGAGFDCASRQEIDLITGIGVAPERIIYANTAKMASHVRHAARMGVATTTFDSSDELIKIKSIMPHAKLVLRIRCDAKVAHILLGTKFGCDPITEAPRLLRMASEQNLDVIGVSFHVGSGTQEFEAYARGIWLCSQLFKVGTELGFNMQLVDIGGGYPGDTKYAINRVSAVVNQALEQYFTDDAVRVIAEPGQYFACAAYTLAACIIAKRQVLENGQRHTMYYMSDGVFGSFMDCVIADKRVTPELIAMKAWTATEQDTSLPCCRTLHIKHAAYASALYTLNISILVVLLYSWRIGVNAKRYKELDDVYYGVQIAYFAIIGTQMFMIMLSIILFYGIYKENVAFLVPWVVGCMTFMALEAMAMVYSNILRDHVNRQFDAMCKAEISFLIPRILLNCLCIWCVLRLYHLLRAGVTWKGAAAIEL